MIQGFPGINPLLLVAAIVLGFAPLWYGIALTVVACVVLTRCGMGARLLAVGAATTVLTCAVYFMAMGSDLPPGIGQFAVTVACLAVETAVILGGAFWVWRRSGTGLR